MTRFVFVMVAGVVVGVCSANAQDTCTGGACCLPDGSCSWTIQGGCELEGGEFLGVGVQCCDVTCVAPQPCRVTGGGVDCAEIGTGYFVEGECSGASGKMKQIDGINVSTFGGQAGAPDSASGEWTHVNHSGPGGKWTFHAGTASAPPETFLQVDACNDEPACDPAKANGFHKQIDVSGLGTFKNGSPHELVLPGDLCEVVIHIEDLGEPGKGKHGRQPNDNGCLEGGHAGELVCPADGVCDCGCPDFYEIVISCDLGAGMEVVYVHSGYLTGGNLQIHEALD